MPRASGTDYTKACFSVCVAIAYSQAVVVVVVAQLIQHGDLLTDASETEYVEIFSQGVCYLLALDDDRQECRRLLPSDDERVTREQPNVDKSRRAGTSA